MPDEKRNLILATPQYTLGYGMRLDTRTAPDVAHPQVTFTWPDGSEQSMTVHVINGTPEQIKARLHERVDAYFEIYADT